MCLEVKDVEKRQPEIIRLLTSANDPCRMNMNWMGDTGVQGTLGSGNSMCKGYCSGRKDWGLHAEGGGGATW